MMTTHRPEIPRRALLERLLAKVMTGSPEISTTIEERAFLKASIDIAIEVLDELETKH
jgi:hypothetical protein